MVRPASPNCTSGNFSYTIKQGDTYYKLAQQFNTTAAAISAANPGIDPFRLKIGQQICIPKQGSIPNCPSGMLYKVKAGDTLYKIAARSRVSLRALINSNPGINPDMIFIGQTICIPKAVPPTAKVIPVRVEGQLEYREARLQKSDLGYYIYLLPNYRLAGEEPGRDILFYTLDDRFFVRIEPLPGNADISQLKENSLTELRLIGTPREMTGMEIFDPFFRNAKFFLHASNPSISKNIIVIEIDGRLFRLTMFIPNAEAAEGVGPEFFAMLKTIEND